MTWTSAARIKRVQRLGTAKRERAEGQCTADSGSTAREDLSRHETPAGYRIAGTSTGNSLSLESGNQSFTPASRRKTLNSKVKTSGRKCASKPLDHYTIKAIKRFGPTS